MLRLTFLGTSAAQPTIGRNLTGHALRRERELFLVDCGEGTQRQMIRYGTGFDVAAICFTHFHADHYLGAIGFLRTLSMQGRVEPLDLYGPRPAKKLLDVMLFSGVEKLTFEVRIHEVSPGDEVKRDGCRLVAFATEHKLASCGWSLVEDDRPGRFHLDRAVGLGSHRGRSSASSSTGGRWSPPAGSASSPGRWWTRPGAGARWSSPATPCPARPRWRRPGGPTSWSTTRPSATPRRRGRSRLSTPRPGRRRG